MIVPLASLALLTRPALWSPKVLAYVAALEAGYPEAGHELAAICERESNCTRIGVHDIDAHLSRKGWLGQVHLGHLDPSCQPYEPRAWATRGPWGLSAASHWKYLPACYHPSVLDDPLTSARVAMRRWVRMCHRSARSGWCAVGGARHDAGLASLAEFGLAVMGRA